MTKRSYWILVLSALLCVSMLFVSCGSDNTDADNLDTSDTTTETPADEKEPIPESEKVNYQSIYEQWSKYIGYRQPEAAESLGAFKLYSYEENGLAASHATENFFYQVNIANGVGLQPTVKLFARNTGKEIDYGAANDSSSILYDFEYYECVVEITRYDSVSGATTYDYYDANGEKLNEAAVGIDDRYQISLEIPDYSLDYRYVKVNDLVYLIGNGEIIERFARGEEQLIPTTNAEYGSYKYYIPAWWSSGDLTIVDSDHHVCARYAINDGYENHRVTVLASGDVLVEYWEMVSEDEELYTYETTYGDRILEYSVIVDAETGKVTEVSLPFSISNLITPASGKAENVAFKGEYQYAEVCKIVDGKLSPRPVFVILDHELKIVEELTPFVKNQGGLVRVLDDQSLLVYADTPIKDELSAWNDILTFVYRVSASGAELYIDEERDVNRDLVYQLVDNGFIYGNKLFNNRLEELYDFTHLESTPQLNESVFRIVVEHEDGTQEQQILFIEGDELKSITLGDETDTVTPLYDVLPMQTSRSKLGQGYAVTERDEANVTVKQSWYTEHGELLVSAEQITVVMETEESCLVRCFSNGIVTYYVIR